MSGPLICIQCSMLALLNDEKPPTFDETLEEHIKRCHPDGAATKAERIELERKLIAKMGADNG
jgi:hypothetical protein